VQSLQEQRAAAMTEAQWQGRITDLCDLLGLKWHHETDSRKSKKGFPDLVIVGDGVIFAELKKSGGKMTLDQKRWYSRLLSAGVETYVWSPEHWPFVKDRLFRLAGRTPVQ
jgi:hypothetical protein